MRVLLAAALALASLSFLPAPASAGCDVDATVSCTASLGTCSYGAAADTQTGAYGARQDCQSGITVCHTEVYGQVGEPTSFERQCYY